MPKILRKQFMYNLLIAGKLGNTFRVWFDVDKFIDSDYRGAVGLRCMNKPRSPCWLGLSPQQAIMLADVMRNQGWDIIISEGSPDRNLTIQGEFAWDVDGWLWLRYSRKQCGMREALRECAYLDGRRAECFLRRYVGQESWADIVWVSQTYPHHIFEFSAYDKPVGRENKPYVIWEVRNY